MEEEKAMESGSGSNEERQVEEQKGLHSEEGDVGSKVNPDECISFEEFQRIMQAIDS